MRKNLSCSDRREHTTEGGYGDHYPPIKQEEVGTSGWDRPKAIIQVVAHRFQHVLPGYLKRQCRTFWSEETDTFILNGPPRDVVEFSISGRRELSKLKGGIRCDLSIALPKITQRYVEHFQTLAELMRPKQLCMKSF